MMVYRIVDLFAHHRLPLSDEKLLQADISKMLAADGLLHRREVTLGAGDVVDFMVLREEFGLSSGLPPGIAIEVKIKGSRRAIFRQVERYCRHDAVEAIILATTVPMNLPGIIEGKPAYVASLGRGWL